MTMNATSTTIKAGRKPKAPAKPTPTLEDIDKSISDAQAELATLQAQRAAYEHQLDDAADDPAQFGLISDAAAALDGQIFNAKGRIAALGRRRRMVHREQVRRELDAAKNEFKREFDASELLKNELAAIDEQRTDIARCHKRKIELAAGLSETIRHLETTLAELEPVDASAVPA